MMRLHGNQKIGQASARNSVQAAKGTSNKMQKAIYNAGRHMLNSVTEDRNFLFWLA